ncbi:MAG: ammonia-forming cytochrome c nitrite reductase subunit c552 [Planctomycetes bacterium]|nr:ammonia-forming cytochrome c nitrite reductase subunit c552 [Planctomycetota bacterium]
MQEPAGPSETSITSAQSTISPPTPPAPEKPAKRRAGLFVYLALLVLTAAATAGVMYLGQNIMERKIESRETAFKLADLDERVIDPAEWGKTFPRQYDGYKRTVDIERTKHGGSDAFQKLDDDPRWRILFKGYAFGVDYREERGHAYMLSDQDMTERVKNFKQPGSCLHCHSSVINAYRKAGADAGVADAGGFNWPQVMKGFEVVCAEPWTEARKRVDHPVACTDCHDPKSMALRVTRPGFVNGIAALAKSDAPTPHLPSIERWRQGNRAKEYDPNVDATRQEMRSFVCGQCHVEYYFKGEGKLVTYPWHKGLKMEQMEAYYDEVKHVDWKHGISGAPILKAQHPEFETWSQGIHARSGVACADCHMPYKREGAIKVSDHHIRSPLLNISRACQPCHNYPESEILARATMIQDRNKALMLRAEDANLALISVIEEARKAGLGDADLDEMLKLHRKAQWRLDFVAAENSMGFHAPQEVARILGESADFARQGEVAVLRKLLGKK